MFIGLMQLVSITLSLQIPSELMLEHLFILTFSLIIATVYQCFNFHLFGLLHYLIVKMYCDLGHLVRFIT